MQLAAFQALCLGLAASAVGLGVGYLLSRWVFHQSTGYLSEAFALAGGTVVAAPTVILVGRRRGARHLSGLERAAARSALRASP